MNAKRKCNDAVIKEKNGKTVLVCTLASIHKYTHTK